MTRCWGWGWASTGDYAGDVRFGREDGWAGAKNGRATLEKQIPRFAGNDSQKSKDLQLQELPTTHNFLLTRLVLLGVGCRSRRGV